MRAWIAAARSTAKPMPIDGLEATEMLGESASTSEGRCRPGRLALRQAESAPTGTTSAGGLGATALARGAGSTKPQMPDRHEDATIRMTAKPVDREIEPRHLLQEAQPLGQQDEQRRADHGTGRRPDAAEQRHGQQARSSRRR